MGKIKHFKTIFFFFFNGKPGHQGPIQPALWKIPLTFFFKPSLDRDWFGWFTLPFSFLRSWVDLLLVGGVGCVKWFSFYTKPNCSWPKLRFWQLFQGSGLLQGQLKSHIEENLKLLSLTLYSLTLFPTGCVCVFFTPPNWYS